MNWFLLACSFACHFSILGRLCLWFGVCFSLYNFCILTSLFIIDTEKRHWEENGALLVRKSVSSVAQSCLTLCNPWTAAHQASLSITNSWHLLKLMSIEPVMPSNHLILCRSLLLLPSIFPSTRVFSNEPTLHIRWPKYWTFSISPSSEYSGLISFQFRSVIKSWLTLCDPHGWQHARLPCPSPTPGACSNSCPCRVGDAIQPPHLLLSPAPPAFNLFQHQSLFKWVSSLHQVPGVTAAASVLPKNIQDWSPLGWTGWISLLSKGLSTVFSNTTVQKHQFFSAQLFL